MVFFMKKKKKSNYDFPCSSLIWALLNLEPKPPKKTKIILGYSYDSQPVTRYHVAMYRINSSWKGGPALGHITAVVLHLWEAVSFAHEFTKKFAGCSCCAPALGGRRALLAGE